MKHECNISNQGKSRVSLRMSGMNVFGMYDASCGDCKRATPMRNQILPFMLLLNICIVRIELFTDFLLRRRLSCLPFFELTCIDSVML
jgi:hypothetical protein